MTSPISYPGMVISQGFFGVLYPSKDNRHVRRVIAQTPNQATQSLIDEIGALVDDGTLRGKDGKKLPKKLDKVVKDFDKAVKDLQKFINEVNKLIDTSEGALSFPSSLP